MKQFSLLYIEFSLSYTFNLRLTQHSYTHTDTIDAHFERTNHLETPTIPGKRPSSIKRYSRLLRRICQIAWAWQRSPSVWGGARFGASAAAGAGAGAAGPAARTWGGRAGQSRSAPPRGLRPPAASPAAPCAPGPREEQLLMHRMRPHHEHLWNI